MATSDNTVFRYPVPAANMASPCQTELTIRKSLFVTRICRCDNAGMARDFAASLKKSFPDATHHCWAFVAGAPADTAHVGFSDDGEPHGTAGRPMLNVLLHSGIGQICAVVSRWFGGIKLGTGGLARAYQDSVLENLRLLPTVELTPMHLWLVEIDYPWLDLVHRSLPLVEAVIQKESYHARIELLLGVPMDKSDSFPDWISGLTNGSATWVDCGTATEK